MIRDYFRMEINDKVQTVGEEKGSGGGGGRGRRKRRSEGMCPSVRRA